MIKLESSDPPGEPCVVPAQEGVTQSRILHDVFLGGMFNLRVFTSPGIWPDRLGGGAVNVIGRALFMAMAAVTRLPASPLLPPRQSGDAGCWPSTD